MATRSPPQGAHKRRPHVVCFGNGMLDVDACGRCARGALHIPRAPTSCALGTGCWMSMRVDGVRLQARSLTLMTI